MAELRFEDLRRVQLHEKSYPQLSPLSEDFYESFRVFLEAQREKGIDGLAPEAVVLTENAVKLAREIRSRRVRKIFLKAVADYRSSSISGEGLAREEKQIYTALVKILSEYEAGFAPLSGGGSASPRERAKDDSVQVRILSDLPEFVGSTSNLGPFSASQVARLPRADAKLLVEQGVAQEVE